MKIEIGEIFATTHFISVTVEIDGTEYEATLIQNDDAETSYDVTLIDLPECLVDEGELKKQIIAEYQKSD